LYGGRNTVIGCYGEKWVLRLARVFESIVKRIGCSIVELNVCPDHVHLLVKIPPKVSVSELIGRVKGRAAIQMFRQFPYLKERPYWDNHFWAKGYCVDTVGVDAEMIRKYVKYQEEKEKNLGLDV